MSKDACHTCKNQASFVYYALSRKRAASSDGGGGLLNHTELSMPLRRSALVLLSQSVFLGLIVGCHPAPKPVVAPLPPPATDEDIASIQAEMLQHDPEARTGSVATVRPSENLAAVTLLPGADGKVAGIKNGDSFVFVDSKENRLASGNVISVEDGGLIVISYVQVPGGRHPKEGDIAVHLSSK
jgi:hypothetical protein